MEKPERKVARLQKELAKVQKQQAKWERAHRCVEAQYLAVLEIQAEAARPLEDRLAELARSQALCDPA
jgi:hypothetical protein